MLSFLFASLFSWIFWLFYFGIGLFVGTIIIRNFAQISYNHYFKGHKGDCYVVEEGVVRFIVVAFNYLFWPICLLIYITILLFKTFLSELLSVCKKIDSMIPDIEIKTKKGNE